MWVLPGSTLRRLPAPATVKFSGSFFGLDTRVSRAHGTEAPWDLVGRRRRVEGGQRHAGVTVRTGSWPPRCTGGASMKSWPEAPAAGRDGTPAEQFQRDCGFPILRDKLLLSIIVFCFLQDVNDTRMKNKG